MGCCRVVGWLSCFLFAGLLCCWIVQVFACWVVVGSGLLACRVVGLLGWWVAELLGCWVVGLLTRRRQKKQKGDKDQKNNPTIHHPIDMARRNARSDPPPHQGAACWITLLSRSLLPLLSVLEAVLEPSYNPPKRL